MSAPYAPRRSLEERKASRKFIQHMRRRIDDAYSEIASHASEHIPDFHFLDWKVSTFWPCDKSPIGMCVFPTHEHAIEHNLYGCRYCGDPEERK